MNKGKVLAIYLEPTPYVLGLAHCLRERWPAGVDLWFAGSNLSQRWELTLDAATTRLLPQSWWRQCRLLRRLLASGDFAVLHLAGWGGNAVLLTAMMLGWLYGVPVSVESDTPLPYELSWWKRAVKRLCYPLLFRLPACFLPGGKRQAALLTHYGVPDSRIVIAGMTVDVTAIIRHRDASDRADIRRRLGVAANAMVLLYVGRMEPHKGIGDLMMAYHSLRQGPRPVCLLLVGEGSLSPELSAAAAMDSQIKVAGRLAGAALFDAYAAADLFVLPSHFEPWGLVVNEAMAAALPVVVSDRAGCVDDLVQSGHNGYVVPAASPAQLATTLQAMLEEPAQLQRMGAASRRLIADWTLEREADNMVGAWKSLVHMP